MVDAKVSGLPVFLMGWNTSFVRKDLYGEEAYYCKMYYLFGMIPIISAYIVKDKEGNWRLWRTCDSDGHYLYGFVFDRTEGKTLLGGQKVFFHGHLED